MQLVEAINVLNTQFPKLKPVSYRDCKSMFIFNCGTEGELDSSWIVNKQTKKVVRFNPTLVPFDEFTKGTIHSVHKS